MAAALQWCRLSLVGCPRHMEPPGAIRHPESECGPRPGLTKVAVMNSPTVSFREVPLGILQEKSPLEGGLGPQVGLGHPLALSSMRSTLRAKCAHQHCSVSPSQLYSRLFEFRLQTKWNSSSRQAGCTAHKSGNCAAVSAGVAWPGGACTPGASCESQGCGWAKGGGNTQCEAMKDHCGSKC